MGNPETAGDIVIQTYRELLLYLNLTPAESNVVHVVFFAAIISFIAMFIWYFGLSLSQRDIIKLNLRQYNTLEHKSWRKFIAVIFYLIEYLVAMPFIIFLWYIGLSVFMLLIADGRQANEILLVSASLVASVRILSYINKDLSSDLAQYFPFITLSVFLLSASAFSFENLIMQAEEIPSLLSNIFYFLLSVFFIEFILRIIYTIRVYWQSEDGFEDVYVK